MAIEYTGNKPYGRYDTNTVNGGELPPDTGSITVTTVGGFTGTVPEYDAKYCNNTVNKVPCQAKKLGGGAA